MLVFQWQSESYWYESWHSETRTRSASRSACMLVNWLEGWSTRLLLWLADHKHSHGPPSLYRKRWTRDGLLRGIAPDEQPRSSSADTWAQETREWVLHDHLCSRSLYCSTPEQGSDREVREQLDLWWINRILQVENKNSQLELMSLPYARRVLHDKH